MTHQQPENNDLWYPQLPTGFAEPTYYAQGYDSSDWMHEMRQMPGAPGYGMPGFGGPGYGMPGFGTPGFGEPGFGQMPSFPGQQFPGGPPGQWSPGSPPPGQWGTPSQQQAPTTPPPQMTPSYPTHQALAVDPGAIRGCLYRMTYIWLSRNQGFWFYPVFVGRTSVAGYRWRRRQRRWVYTGFDLDRIQQFTCF